MNYTIGELSRQIGVGREAIRHYENKGLIVSKRNASNGYRYYDDLDGLSLLHTRFLQSYALPLSQIYSNMRLWTLSQQEALLKDYETKLRQELEETQKRLTRIRRIRGFIEDSRERAGSFWEAELRGLYKILILGDRIERSPRHEALVRSWQDRFPITDIGWHIFMDDVIAHRHERIPTAISLTVLDEYIEEHGFDIAPPVFHFPGGHSVRTILSIANPFDLRYEDIAPFFEYVDRRGYRILTDLTGRYGGCEFINGKPRYFFTLRAIVEKKSDSTP